MASSALPNGTTYEDDPPILAMLHAKEIPSSKGGTMFADMRAAHTPVVTQHYTSSCEICRI
jgi:alpha-ketoglutarate-dependent taurine dioxygenase